MSIQEYKKLCSAILINSLDDICKGGENGLDALQWIHNSKDNYIFDFIVICRVLDLDPKGIRAAVKTNKIKELLDRYKTMKLSPKVEQIKTKPKSTRRVYVDRGRRVASKRIGG
jgi:hypothetical protein